jgi:glycosyltransferase involved in cell wall biosynthesis
VARKVLYLIPTLEYRGRARQLQLLATSLPSFRFSVRVAALGRNGPAAQALHGRGIATDLLGWRRALDLQPLLRLARLIKHWQPDIIHTWGRPCLRAVALTGGLGRRLVVSGLAAPDSSRPWLQRLDVHLARRAFRIVVPTGGVFGHRDNRRFLPPQLVAIPPATPLPELDGRRQPTLRDRLQLPATARLLMCAGPLEAHKNYKDAIWAFDILNYLYDDLQLIFIGDGLDRRRLEAFVHTIQTTGKIHFLGSVPDAAALLAEADVVWIPAPAQGGVQVALEAMAAARPVVARRDSAAARVLAHGETGYLVPRGDQPAFARQTRFLLDDPELRHRMGEAGRQRVRSHFTVQRMVNDFARLYDDQPQDRGQASGVRGQGSEIMHLDL